MQSTQLLFRSKIFVLLAASVLALAAVGAKAQRLIDVSLRCEAPIDLCSTDSSFVLICDVGSLNVGDSLLMYDITLSFPKDQIILQQVLFSGTASENLEYKDHNAKTDGELRVYGFNLFKPIVGSKPLFAVQFKRKAQCSDTVRIGFAAVPSFNPEAKILLNNLNSTTVATQILDLRTRSLNCKFSNDTIVFTKRSQIASFSCQATTNAGARLQFAQFELKYDKSKLVLKSLEAVNTLDSLFAESKPGSELITLVSKSTSFLSQSFGFNAQLVRLSDSTSLDSSAISIKLVQHNQCACITRDTADTMNVIVKIPDETEVADFDSNLKLQSDGDVWELHNMTDSRVECDIYSLLGVCVHRMWVEAHSTAVVQRSDLPRGVVLLQYVLERDQIKKQLKFN